MNYAFKYYSDSSLSLCQLQRSVSEKWMIKSNSTEVTSSVSDPSTLHPVLKSCGWTNVSFLACLHVSMLGIYFLCSFIFWMQIQVSNLKIPEANSLPLWVKSFSSSLFHVCCMYAGLNSAAHWIFLQACWMNRSDQQWTRNYLHSISCLVCLAWFLESLTCKPDFLFTSVPHWIKAMG